MLLLLDIEGRWKVKNQSELSYTQELVGKKKFKSQAELLYPGIGWKEESKEPSRAFILRNWAERKEGQAPS